MGDKPWNVLWEDFIGEATRFDGRKLNRLFGDTQPIRRPPNNPKELTQRDRLLIGEFLRRHHPRLAQEIALFGVPTDVPNLGDIPQTEQGADVVVSVEKGEPGKAWVTISDKGIGMTSEVVTDYFLTAGASFRRSEDWRKAFETKDGQSKILRAGRFGVGALASFLLGPEIKVSTRHIEEDCGIEFIASVESDSIELRKSDRPVGTTIKIQISEALAKQLGNKPHGGEHYYHSIENEGEDWDWYSLPAPSLERTVFGKQLKSRCTIPNCNEKLPPDWRKTSHPDYAGILWTYSNMWGPYKYLPSLICNGIKVYEERPSHTSGGYTSGWEARYGLKLPHVSVFDPNGQLPLNLQRTDLAEARFPFDQQLMSDVAEDFIAFALVNGPTEGPESFDPDGSVRNLAYAGSSRLDGRYYNVKDKSTDWYFTKGGFGYVSPSIFKSRAFSSMLVMRIGGPGDNSAEKIPLMPSETQPGLFLSGDGGLMELDGYLRALVESGYDLTTPKQEAARWNQTNVKLFPRTGLRFLVSNMALQRAKKKLPQYLQSKLKEEWNIEGWQLMQMGDCPKVTFDFESIVRKSWKLLGERSVIAEIYLDNRNVALASPVAVKWLEILQQEEIPFDLKLRRQQLKHAYERLSKNVEAHEAVKAQQEKELKANGRSILSSGSPDEI